MSRSNSHEPLKLESLWGHGQREMQGNMTQPAIADFEDEGIVPKAKQYEQTLKAKNSPWLSTKKKAWPVL